LQTYVAGTVTFVRSDIGAITCIGNVRLIKNSREAGASLIRRQRTGETGTAALIDRGTLTRK
jgi:hypothetical protein